MYRPMISVALPVPEIIAIGVFLGGDCEPQSSGRGGRRGSGMVHLERISYRPSIVIFFQFSSISSVQLQNLCFTQSYNNKKAQLTQREARDSLGI